MTTLFNNKLKTGHVSSQDAHRIVGEIKAYFKNGYGRCYKAENHLNTWRFHQPKTKALFGAAAEEATRLILQAAHARGQAPRDFAQQVIYLLQEAAQQGAERQSVLAQAMNEVGSVLATHFDEVETSSSGLAEVISGTEPQPGS